MRYNNFQGYWIVIFRDIRHYIFKFYNLVAILKNRSKKYTNFDAYFWA